MPAPELVVHLAPCLWCRPWLSGRAGRASGDSPARRATRRINRTRPRSASARSSATMQHARTSVRPRWYPRSPTALSVGGTHRRVPRRRALGRDPPRHHQVSRGQRARPQPCRAPAWPHSRCRGGPRLHQSPRCATRHMAPLVRLTALPGRSRRRRVSRKALAFVTPMRPAPLIRPLRSRAPGSVRRSPPGARRCCHRQDQRPRRSWALPRWRMTRPSRR